MEDEPRGHSICWPERAQRTIAIAPPSATTAARCALSARSRTPARRSAIWPRSRRDSRQPALLLRGLALRPRHPSPADRDGTRLRSGPALDGAFVPRRQGQDRPARCRDTGPAAIPVGELTAARTPDEGHEAMRDLIRATPRWWRSCAVPASRLSGFHLHHERVFRVGCNRTRKHRGRLSGSRFQHPVQSDRAAGIHLRAR